MVGTGGGGVQGGGPDTGSRGRDSEVHLRRMQKIRNESNHRDMLGVLEARQKPGTRLRGGDLEDTYARSNSGDL